MTKPMLAVSAALWLVAGPAAAEAPRVVASIQPVHSLVSTVMDGIGEPFLIVRGYGSPHNYQMRPSEAQALQDAEVVFWVGEGMETFLMRPLAALGARARIVELMDLDGLVLHEPREGGAFETHVADHDHGHGHAHDDHGHGPYDAHIWLDPDNARIMVEAIALTLAEVDSANAERYLANAEAARARLAALDEELETILAPVRHAPFVVFHDAYQSLERRYGLNAVGAITVAPDRMPGARRLSEIRARIRALGARCVFREPQFESALIATVVGGTGAEVAVLDPLGADLEPGAEAYLAMMRANARAIAGCLAEPS